MTPLNFHNPTSISTPQLARNSSTNFTPPRTLILFTILLTIAILALRITAPSDIHDQTQPKTIAYTVNIALHPTDWKRWILPLENDQYPATKPPLYNWLAVPFVALTRGHYEWPHKIPSIIAFLLLGSLIITTLRRIEFLSPIRFSTTPYLGFIIFAANYMFVKLSYLARPDTILTLFLILGWIAATQLVINNNQSTNNENLKSIQRPLQFIFWLSIALAMLAKGPVAVLILFYLFFLIWILPDPNLNTNQSNTNQHPILHRLHPRRIIKTITRAARLSGAAWGIPLAILPFALWFFLAWTINPDHVYGTLIRKEIVDRILGLGSDPASTHSPWEFLITLPAMPASFFARFLPWSIFFLAALLDLFGRKRPDRIRGLPEPSTSNNNTQSLTNTDNHTAALRIWLISSIISTIIPIAFFSLSIGKRGDYIAASFIPASMLIAYWANHLGLQLAVIKPKLFPIIATVTVAALGLSAFSYNLPAKYPLGSELWNFARKVRPVIDDNKNPLPVSFYRTGRTPIQTVLYRSQSDTPDAVKQLTQSNKPFHLIIRAKYLDEFNQQPWIKNWTKKEIVRSTPTPGDPNSKPYQVFLYTLTPLPK